MDQSGQVGGNNQGGGGAGWNGGGGGNWGPPPPWWGNWNGGGNGGGNDGDNTWGGGGNEPLGAPVVKLSKELEESFGAMASFFKLSLDEKNRAEAAKKEKEERKKRDEQERIEKVEITRAELAKKEEEQKKEADRDWTIPKLFSEQRVFLQKEVKKAVNEEIHDMVNKKGKKVMEGDECEEWEEEQEEEEEEEELAASRRRKRVPTQERKMDNGSPNETPPKATRGNCSRQPVFQVASPVEQERKGRGRPKKKDTGSLIMDPWGGAPCSADFRNKVSYEIAVVKFVGKKLCPKLKEMCKKEGAAWRGKKDEAVEELAELRVMQSVFESHVHLGSVQ
ncbi:hypothetical protein CBR_g34333 [Chara braunii]|uniref:Uncharacterized protein n=1 Tax=Chara braunii TaxID=69332 RepID=A0A388LI94_CHABU|nr:hypothetical protein CBR_g34333 [Chara braunii]|eukprot:GBG82054.1 hypothetical protein CBR_g34333 [Chara braunii]